MKQFDSFASATEVADANSQNLAATKSHSFRKILYQRAPK
jgi:hypothetical protein